jgi:hypothetical protein
MRDHSRREQIEKAAIPSRGFHFGSRASAAAFFILLGRGRSCTGVSALS